FRDTPIAMCSHPLHSLHLSLSFLLHHPPHTYLHLLSLHDALPILSEIPLWQFETHHYQIQEKRQISYQMWREMVFSNFNRPSIIDRKSTRLNSSHVSISYAVFCLKKKK